MKDKPYDKVAVGERIRKARELNQFTQEHLDLCQYIGPSVIIIKTQFNSPYKTAFNLSTSIGFATWAFIPATLDA